MRLTSVGLGYVKAAAINHSLIVPKMRGSFKANDGINKEKESEKTMTIYILEGKDTKLITE